MIYSHFARRAALRLAAAFVALLLGSAAMAQHALSHVELGEIAPEGWLEVEFDENYEASFDIALPVHFVLPLPTFEGVPQLEMEKGEGAMLARFTYFDDTRRVMERVEMLTYDVGSVGAPDPVVAMLQVIRDVILPVLRGPNADPIRVWATQSNGRPVADYVALGVGPSGAPMVVRILGVLAPDDRTAVFFISQRSALSLTVNDAGVGPNFAGIALSNMEFVAYRDADGVLQPF